MTQKKSESQEKSEVKEKSPSKDKPEVKEKSTSKEKPEVKEKSTSKDKPESNDKSASKGKPASKEKSPSKEKSESKKKTANKAKLTSKIKLDKPELNKFTVGGIVVLMIVVLGIFYASSGKKATPPEKDSEPVIPELVLTAQELSEEEPKPEFTVPGEDGKQITIEVPENDISQQTIPEMTYSATVALSSLENVNDEVYEHSNAVIDNEGLFASYRTVGENSRNVFMDKNFYKDWRDNPTNCSPTGSTFYLDPTFIIMEDELNKLSETAASLSQNGEFEISIPVLTTHHVFEDAALKAIKGVLKSKNVPNADALKKDQLRVIPVTNCSLGVDGKWTTTSGTQQDGKIWFHVKFKDLNSFNKFKGGLLAGKCELKYGLYGQRVIPSSLKLFVKEMAKELNEIGADSEVKDEGFKAGAKSLNVERKINSGGKSAGLGSMPGAIFFDITGPTSSSLETGSEGEQFIKRNLEIKRNNDLFNHMANIVGRAGASMDVLKGTESEKKNEMLAIAKLLMEQAVAEKKCPKVEGTIESYNSENNSFVLNLSNGLEKDLSPSEVSSLKDTLSSAINEVLSKNRDNQANVDIKGIKAGAHGQNSDSSTLAGNAAFDALLTSAIHFPVSFEFYRISEFLMNLDQEYEVNLREWETGVYPAKNGFVAVCEEIPDTIETFKCPLDEQIILPNHWVKGEGQDGCMARNTTFSVNASVDVKESNEDKDVNVLVFTFNMHATIHGNSLAGSLSSYQKTIKPLTKSVHRKDVVATRNSERGAVFEFLTFVDKSDNDREYGSGYEASGKYTVTDYNQGDSNYDKPHGKGPIDLLAHCPDIKKYFSQLTATGEYHNYYKQHHEKEWWEFPHFFQHEEWDTYHGTECVTNKSVSLSGKPCFYYKARTHLPTVIMKSNQGVRVMVDENGDKSYDDDDNEAVVKDGQNQTQ